MWRAIRFGLDGRLIDLERGEEYPARAGDRAAGRLDGAGARRARASTSRFPERNGAQRQRRMIEAGATREEVFAASVRETQADLFTGGAGMSATSEPGGRSAGQPQPSEEELRAAYEAELSASRVADMIAADGGLAAEPRRRGGSACAPGAARTGGERDLEQVRDAIDGVRALLPSSSGAIPQELRPLRDALSQLQMAYAREAQARAGAAGAGADAPGAGRRRAGGRGAAPGRAGRRGRARRGRPSERPGPGASRAGGCGCPGAERRAAAAAPRAGTIDSRPRLRRVGARAERPGRQMCARRPRAARKSDRGGFLLSSFLTNHGVVVALVCAACAVVYGAA